MHYLWVFVCSPGFGALVALAAAGLAYLSAGKTANANKAQAEREEHLRSIRWAAEHAISDSEERRSLGVAALNAVNDAYTLDKDDAAFLRKVLTVTATDQDATYTENIEYVLEGGTDGTADHEPSGGTRDADAHDG